MRATKADATNRALALRARMLAHPTLRALADLSLTSNLDLHLVGGVPRDLLLGREPLDIDLAMRPDPAPLAAWLREQAGGTIVALDEDRSILRLVCSGGGAPVLDFARFRADTIEADLQERDLTINAIAIPLQPLLGSTEVRWIDPTGGADDIWHRRIRFTSSRAPVDDPLRMVRAYRFACELGFSLPEDARAIVKDAACGIRRVAPERITYEVLKILGAPRPAWAISDLDELGVLPHIIPEVDAMRGVTQNAYHHLDVLGHSLLTLARMEEILLDPGAVFPEWRERLSAYVAGCDRRALLMLAALLHDVAKPGCRASNEQGKLTFYGHAEVGSSVSREILRRLRLSNRQVDLVSLWVHHHMRLANHQSLFNEGRLPDRSLFRTYRKLGEEVVGEILLTLADLRATGGPQQDPTSEQSFIRLGNRMLGLYFEEFIVRRQADRLVTGRDLIDLGLEEGPEIGRVLQEIEDALLEGGLADREHALALARRLVAAGRSTRREPPGCAGENEEG